MKEKIHIPVYGVIEFVCLSVINFDPNYLRTGRTEWAEIFFRTSMAKSHVSKNFICPKSGPQGQG